jgi:hypothetical protein
MTKEKKRKEKSQNNNLAAKSLCGRKRSSVLTQNIYRLSDTSLLLRLHSDIFKYAGNLPLTTLFYT